MTRDHLREQLREKPPHLALLRAVESRLMCAVPLLAPVLDIGTGDGHFASSTYQGLPIDVGLEVDAGAVRETAARPGVYRHLVRAGAESLPFPARSFRTVVSNCVLEHVLDLDAALGEIGRVLREPESAEAGAGGIFATTVPSEHFAEFLLGASALRRLGLGSAADGYGRFFNRISRHYHVYPLSTWREKLSAAGLEVLEAVDYFSAAAHRRFDLSHYLGLPNLIRKRLLGSWTPIPGQTALLENWLRSAYEEPLPTQGAYRFLLCRKRAPGSL